MNLFTHVILDVFISFILNKVFGSDTAAELLKKKTLKEIGNANDFDCVDSRPRNHMSPDLRYCWKFIHFDSTQANTMKIFSRLFRSPELGSNY